jgi:hypothetical protein
MNRFRNALLCLAAALLIAQALLFTAPGQALAGTISEVLVTNTVANPVPVRDVDNGRQPKMLASSFNIPDGQTASMQVINTTSIPQGKRFIAEFVTVRIAAPAGQAATRILLTVNSSDSFSFPLSVSWQGDSGSESKSYYTGTHMTRLYVDPGANKLVWEVDRNGTSGVLYAYISFSGYLVDVS